MMGCWLLAGTAPSAEPAEYISEEEVQTYLVLLGQNLGQCDLEWLQQQFTPSAKIRLSYPGSRRQTFTVPGYIEYMRSHCNPLAFEKRQFTSMRISDGFGGTKTVQWKFWWGRRPGATVSNPSTASIMFDNEAMLVKQGERIQIAELVWRAKELVPGAARLYFHEVPAPIDAARRAVDRTGQALQQWNERILQWFSKRFRKPASAHDNGWN